MHNLNNFVRDFYFFKRSQYPQLSLIKISAEDSFKALQKQSLNLQFIEVGKVLKSLALLKNTNQVGTEKCRQNVVIELETPLESACYKGLKK